MVKIVKGIMVHSLRVEFGENPAQKTGELIKSEPQYIPTNIMGKGRRFIVLWVP